MANHEIKRVAVYCGSSAGSRDIYANAARRCGNMLARSGITVVYGGGRSGMMGEVARSALAAGGQVIGVIPHGLTAVEPPLDGLTELHYVHTMHERKAMMAELADAFIALPGGYGTCEELFEVLAWAQLTIHRNPCGLLNVDGYYSPLIQFLDRASVEGFIRAENRAMLLADEDPERLLERMRAYEPPTEQVWREPADA